jgi:hypothetical protein
MARSLVLLALVVAALAGSAVAGVVSGDLYMMQPQMGFVARFTFSKSESRDIPSGFVNFTLSVADPAKAQQMKLYIFDDQDDSWPALYGKGLSCQTFVQQAKNKDTPTSIVWNSDNQWVETGRSFNEITRPRVWYFVVSNCDSGLLGATFSGVSMVNVHLQNNYGTWNREFGTDQAGLNTLYVLFWLHSVGLGFAWLYGLRSYQEAGGLSPSGGSADGEGMHPLLKLLTGVVVVYFLGMMCVMIHFIKYSNDGVGSGIRGFGDFMVRVCVHCCLFCRVCLVSYIFYFARLFSS